MSVSSDIDARVDIVSERVDVLLSTPRDVSLAPTSVIAASEIDDWVVDEPKRKRPKFVSKYFSTPFMFYNRSVQKKITPLVMQPLMADRTSKKHDDSSPRRR